LRIQASNIDSKASGRCAILIQKVVRSDSIIAPKMLPADFYNNICQERPFRALPKSDKMPGLTASPFLTNTFLHGEL
jgi:hypothetical protein